MGALRRLGVVVGVAGLVTAMGVPVLAQGTAGGGERPYCAVGAVAVPLDATPEQRAAADARVTRTCFATDAEAAAFVAHGGAAGVTATSRLAPASSTLVAASSVTLGVDYDYTYRGGAATYFYGTGASGCDGSYTFGFPTMTSGWNDRVSSAVAYAGCRSQHYANTYYGGSSVTCATYCPTMGALDNQTSSVVFRP